MSSNSFKVKNSLVLTPKDLTTLVSPEAGDIACDINDNNKIKKYDAVTSSWSEVGSGASSLDDIFQLIGDDVSSWSKGNNATFLGGGSLAGTFATDSVAPLNGLQSYKYTQAAGSLNDYIASPAKSVPLKFRGQTCSLSFPFSYTGTTNDIQIVLYDVTNSAVIPSSTYILGSSSVTTSVTYITIPLTCTSIRVGFQVKVANSLKVFSFDDITLSSNTTQYANIATGVVGEILTSASTVTPANFLACDGSAVSRTAYASLFASIGVTHGSGDGSTTFNLPDYRGRFLRGVAGGSANDPDRASRTAMNTGGNTGDNVGSVQTDAMQQITGSTSGRIMGSWAGSGAITATNAGTSLYGGGGGNGRDMSFDSANSPGARTSTETRSKNAYVNYYIRFAQSSPNGVVSAVETFSTDTAALTYAGSASYTLSTLSNAPVGTFITFTYAANTNTRTQTATAPSQSTAGMNANGIQVFTRAYNAASTAGNPACIAIQIGKGLKGLSLNSYFNTGKVSPLSNDFFIQSTTIARGLPFKEYNESTGILTIDAGYNHLTTLTNTGWAATDGSGGQSTAYIVINASKNPALTGFGLNTVAVRATSTAGGAIGVGGTIQSFAQETFDTNDAWDGTAFIAPENGYYKVDARLTTQAVTLTTSQALNIMIYKNGSMFSIALTRGNGTSTAYPASISDLVY
jgi:microcystin-dependent protein